jgi:hypothetical protein
VSSSCFLGSSTCSLNIETTIAAAAAAGSRRSLLQGVPVTITLKFNDLNGGAARRAARAAGPPHSYYGTSTATGPQRRVDGANDVVRLTGVPGPEGLKWEVQGEACCCCCCVCSIAAAAAAAAESAVCPKASLQLRYVVV